MLCFCHDDFHDNYHRNGNLENPMYFPDDYPSQTPFAFLIDAPPDKAREHIHNQCDELSAHARFSCPTYSAKDIQVSMCSSWSVTDFTRAIEHATYQAMQQGKSRSDVEQELLREYEFYCLPAFRDYLKTLPAYRPHIKKLRDGLVAQKGKGYRILRALGFLNPEYVHKLDLAEELYAEIVEEEQEEHRIAQQKLYQKAEQAQQELQCKQEARRTTFDQQCEHHYIAEHLNEMGIKLLNSGICKKTELILADVLCDGHLEADKTFFPTSWSREKVIKKSLSTMRMRNLE